MPDDILDAAATDAPAPSPHTPPIADRVERRRRPHPVDRALNLLLLEAERDMQVGLTVSVDGTVVSGTLISRMEYFHTLASHFVAHDGTTDMGELFADSLHRIVDDAQRLSQAEAQARMGTGASAGAADDEPVVEFLHLADARYVSGSGFMPHGRHGVLWRCRVSDISGWSLGDLTLT